MSKRRYSHRNGESEEPTVPGWYIIKGPQFEDTGGFWVASCYGEGNERGWYDPDGDIGYGTKQFYGPLTMPQEVG